MMNAVMIKVRFYIWTNYGLKIDNKNYKKREIQMKWFKAKNNGAQIIKNFNKKYKIKEM